VQGTNRIEAKERVAIGDADDAAVTLGGDSKQ